ncbi:hypothetical protein EVAR_43320_1 [Eumeta japonica]|uniref:Uncharacterized protein n=1 Tax=Eumeta variegata TaxID=151549 RepID=A0A4C1WSC7_EUMVA|nr:hypothetical protein EVAR_43320_1 [Eumeta japonica]
MSSRRVVKGASLSKSERDGNVPALTKGAQKLMVATKKSVKQQKSELTPPSEKAPQKTPDGAGTSAAATASVKTKAASERASAPLTISPPKLLVEVEPMDKIAALGKETDWCLNVEDGLWRLGDITHQTFSQNENIASCISRRCYVRSGCDLWQDFSHIRLALERCKRRDRRFNSFGAVAMQINIGYKKFLCIISRPLYVRLAYNEYLKISK